jgi:hypothetical protein
MRGKARLLTLVLLVSVVSAPPVLAYIDPATGGALFQVLAAAFALLSGVALMFSRQIRVAFARALRFVRRSLRGLAGRESSPGEDDQPRLRQSGAQEEP